MILLTDARRGAFKICQRGWRVMIRRDFNVVDKMSTYVQIALLVDLAIIITQLERIISLLRNMTVRNGLPKDIERGIRNWRQESNDEQ